MLIGLPVSIPFGAISLAGVTVTSVAMALTKEYLKKLLKVKKLVDIIMSALIMFIMSVSKVLNNGRVDKKEFNMLQALHLELFNDLSNVGSKMAAETRCQFQKTLLEKLSVLTKKELRRRDALQCAQSFLHVILHAITVLDKFLTL